jgi:hypothetical protein
VVSRVQPLQREAQKVDRLRTFTPVFARVPLCEAAKFYQFGLGRFQRSGRTSPVFCSAPAGAEEHILEAHHKVVDIPRQIGLPS